MMSATPITPMTLSQLSVDQGEGKPPVVFEVYYDEVSGRKWREKIFKKVHEFSLAIRNKKGYSTVLRRDYDPLDDINILYVDIIGANQTYVFFVNDFMCDVKIQKEVF